MKLLGIGPITLVHPQMLYLLGAVAVLLIIWLVQIDAPRKVFAPLLRALVLSLVVLVLAQPETRSTSEGAAKPVAVDLSASMTPAMREYAAGLLRNELKLRADDPAIAFAGTPVVETVGTVLRQLAGPGCASCEPMATDLESAIDKLTAQSGGGSMVLITDGWENRGQATAAVGSVLANHGQLEILAPPADRSLPSVAVSSLTLPHALANTNSFDAGVTLTNYNDHPVSGVVRLDENNRLLAQRQVTLGPGSLRVDFPVRDIGAGLTSYQASFQPSDPADDLYRGDNRLEGWVGVGAKRKVLIFSDSERDSTYLSSVARRLGFEAEIAAPSDTRYNHGLAAFDAVIMDNVARPQMPAATQQALERYVSAGGALAMVGGDRSFGLGGWKESEIAKMMPVIMKPPQHQERRRALVVIIDKSGSMGRENKLVYAQMAAQTAAQTLRNDDLIEVIGFDSQPFVVIPLEAVGTARPYFAQMVDRLKARGTTYLLPALQQADRDLAASGASIKHVIILTDGETGGTAAMYYDLVASMHHQGGVTVSTIAVGREANVTLLDAISRYGGGAAYQTDSPRTLPDITLQDTRQHTAEQTMVEKQFVPETAPADPLLKALAGRSLPPIQGYVSTQLRPHARLDAWVTRGGHREPLIASTSYGAGKTLAVTTDGGARWAVDWVRRNVFGTLWDHLLGWMTPPATNMPDYDVAMGFRNGRIALELTDYSANLRSAPAVVSAHVTRPDGTSEDALLSQTGPGEQAGSFAAPVAGTYYIALHVGNSSKEPPVPPLAYTVSPANFIEVPHPAPNYGLLERLAAATGGRLNPSAAQVAMARPHFEHSAGFSMQLLIAAILLLVLEAVVRRLTA